MLSQLLESAPRRRQRSPVWTLASAVAHTAIIAGAVAVTTRPEDSAASPVPPKDTIVVWVPAPDVPPQPRAPRPADPGELRIPMPNTPIDVDLPVIRPTFDVSKPFASGTATIDPFGPGLAAEGPPSPTPAPGGIYNVGSVTIIAAPVRGNPRPDYPQSLRNAALEGEVLVTFVVDTTGRVAPGSITIVTATHEQFGDAVRRWLPRTRYIPAEVRGAKVRQLVQQRIDFALQR